METLTVINTIILSIGMPTILATAVYTGRKLQVLDELKITVDKIKQNLNHVCNHLVKNSSSFNPNELNSFSPLKLTQEGMDFISEIGFDKVFSKNKKEFFEFIEGEMPKVKYDVENASIRSILFLYDKDFMEILKVYFYNNPNRNLQNTAPTLGVYIRDKYLEEHSEIDK